MEDVIYIVLAIAWLVISIIGGRKKKQAQQAKSIPQKQEVEPYETPTPTSKSEIEDMLEDFFGTGKAKPSPSPYNQPEPMVAEEAPHSFSDYTTEKESLETIEETQYSQYQGNYSVSENYIFSQVPGADSMEELIRSYELSDRLAQEENSKLAVLDIHGEHGPLNGFDFDGRKAMIYSEILKRKYT